MLRCGIAPLVEMPLFRYIILANRRKHMTTETLARLGLNRLVLPRPTLPRLTWRSFYRVPVIGWIARDLIEGDADNVWYLLAAILCLWIMAIMTWGLPALYLPAVIAAPLVLLLLVVITFG
jgi:hypothetical protein